MDADADERRADNDRKIARDVEAYGCHVISVFDPEETHPPFSYSVGIQATSQAPEAIVIGLSSQLGHAMINEYNTRVRQRVEFRRGIQYTGFLEGFGIYVEPTRSDRLSEYTLGCTRYYKGSPYAVVQLIYPTTSGLWPWQTQAPERYKANQPMLGRKHPQRR
ncbi:MAG: DUF4262 domain-containing protein [Gammaproteobacteria bacterium]|nr:DUF4262 domain-containing protein [Gammaproteobacteria bacterium]